MRLYFTVILIIAALTAACPGTSALCSPKDQKARTIAVLHSYDSELPWVISATDSLRTAVRQFKGVRFSLNIEYLDLARELNPEYRQKIKELIRIKYLDEPPDIVLCADTLAAYFFNDYGSQLFPDIPVVFSITEQTYHSVKDILPDKSAVVTNRVDHAGTLDLALTVFPKTRQIFVISGHTKGGRLSEAKLKQISAEYENRVRFHYLSGLEYEKILETVETLPENSIIFQLIFLVDTTGKKHTPARVVEAVSKRANAPVFTLYEPMMGHGTIGGLMVSSQNIQTTAIKLAAQLLHSPDTGAGTVISSANRPIFDWRQLTKWQIKENMLPQNSDIRFKQYSFFQLYRKEVITVASLLVVLAVLILFLALSLIRRKKTEAFLRESRKELEESLTDLSLKNFVLENAPISVLWLDSAGRILYANEMAAQTNGYTRKEILELNISDIDLNMSKEGFARLWQKMNDGNPVYMESVHIRKDGSQFPAEIHARQNTHKNHIVNVGFVLDASNRKEMEETLKISENRYRSVLKVAMDGFMITDSKGHLTEVNPAFCQMTGYSEAELLSMEIADLEVVNSREQIQEQISQIINTGQMRFESRHRHKSGRILDVEISSQYHTDLGDYFFCFIRDLTAQKQIQAELQQSQKMEAIGTLAGGIAHDFNNILGVIIGYGEIIRYRIKDDSGLMEYVEQILNAGQRAKDLVRQILLFSRKGEQEHIPLNLQSMVKEILKFLRATLPPGIEIQTAFSDRIGMVLADPGQVHQIIMNLCTNAVYAMEEDKGRLFIGLEQVIVDKNLAATLPGLQPGDFIQIKIRDTGTGIPDEIIDQIFDPFFTTKPNGKGTGLGLSVVHGILKNHGGAVKVYSEPEKGTTFNIFLPVFNADEPLETHEENLLPTGLETILFIDDETDLVEVLKAGIESLGYTVKGFSDSNAAWDHFKTDPDKFDLVITDKNMPGMTGIQLAEKISALRPGIPIIMCTGFLDTHCVEQAKLKGIFHVINKPVFIKELAVTIHQALGSRQK